VTRRWCAAALALPLLLAGCSHDAPAMDPRAQASAPVPGVTLPPGDLVQLVPTPAEVPAGMTPVIRGSGSRTVEDVAGYSGEGPAKAAALTALRAHGFVGAYVAQYASPTTGQVLSVVVTRFGTAEGARADFSDDEKGTTGTPVPTATLGDASSVTRKDLGGSVTSQLVLVRVLRGTDTWTIAYQAAPTADPQVPVGLARTVLARTAT
jgi:hypothetical protein